MQILNLACHGTIYQDLSENPSFFNHSPNAMFRHDPVHLIQSEEQTLLSHLIGKQAKVNSFHHQAVKEPGSGLRVCAVSPDGVIEAIEDESHPFLLGVQWHPECMYLSSRKMSRIFSSFLEAC
ncbi:gamma-glutamyl-gamma-aminobutyrate hydrolase family protein [Sellimonas intestinalis]